jgi:hypothetical protein
VISGGGPTSGSANFTYETKLAEKTTIVSSKIKRIFFIAVGVDC